MKHKVKIAFAIDRHGKWAATGHGDVIEGYNSASFDWIVDDLENGERRYLIEVEVEVPNVETLTGEAKAIHAEQDTPQDD